MRKVWIALFVSGLLAGLPLLAKKPWLEKPPDQWTQEEANEVLTKSPWVRQETIGLFLGQGTKERNYTDVVRPGGRGGAYSPNPSTGEQQVQRQVFWTQVTWVAEPIRRAHARLAQLQGRSSSIQGNPDIIQFFIRGEALPRLTGSDDPHIRTKTYLKTSKGEPIPVQQVVISEDFARNPLVVLAFPAQVNGQPILVQEDREVQLVVQLGEEKQLKTKFKLKDMVVDGKLML